MPCDPKPLPAEADALARARAGDPRAWQLLFQMHAEALLRLATAVLRHEEDARDVCQETFQQAILKLPEWNGEGRFDLWLKRIVINRSRDLLRKRRVRQVAAEDLSRERDVPPLSPEFILSERESADRILRGLDRLPPEYREVLIPHFLEDLRYPELAELLEISVNAVRIRIHRGLARLREMIQEDVP
jgi:RNA polymerase sigma-70 factor (ECF subfamily)